MHKQEYINCDYEVTSPQYIHSIKQLSITHAVHNKTTISFNS